MTKKEHLEILHEIFPNASMETLGFLSGSSRCTARWHLNPEHREQKRKYHRGWQIQRVSQVKSILVDFLGGCCYQCGYSGEPDAFDFHHKKPEDKKYSVSDLLLGNFEKAAEEARKCILLCCRCHRELHAENGTGGKHHGR